MPGGAEVTRRDRDPMIPRTESATTSPESETLASGQDGRLGAARMQRALQRRAARGRDEGAPSKMHEQAQAGLSGGAQQLPHLDRIQASFGRHDASAIQAHVGGPATEASEVIGAKAYATGDSVAFREAPDLHTAA